MSVFIGSKLETQPLQRCFLPLPEVSAVWSWPPNQISLTARSSFLSGQWLLGCFQIHELLTVTYWYAKLMPLLVVILLCYLNLFICFYYLSTLVFNMYPWNKHISIYLILENIFSRIILFFGTLLGQSGFWCDFSWVLLYNFPMRPHQIDSSYLF